MRSRFAPLSVLVLLAGCAGASARSGASATPTPSATASPTSTTDALLSGRLVGGTGSTPGGIGGVHYRTATQSGFTDAAGTFSYRAGETVTFGIADVEMRATAGEPFVSPWQLVASGACEQGPELARLLVLLDSADADGDPANGLALPQRAPSSPVRDFAVLSDADIAALVVALVPGRALVTSSAATNAFVTQMDGEEWAQVGMDSFPGGLTKSQGVATDGATWFFSWKLGLEKDDLATYSTLTSNTLAIPSAQAALGDNHIGDIDFANGTLYVPLEDGSAYQHPYLATYDPATLTSTAVYPVSTDLMTAGVPWVAADGARGALYIAQWDPTPEIYVFDLASVAYVRSIPLSTVVGRIQGAKVFEGSLYLSTDDADKDVFKVNLDTGTVIPLFALHLGTEEEGLAFLPRPDGSLMHTLNVSDGGLGMDFRHHARTRPPLRASVCPSN